MFAIRLNATAGLSTIMNGSFIATYISSPIIWIEWITLILSILSILRTEIKGHKTLLFILLIIVIGESSAIWTRKYHNNTTLSYYFLVLFIFPGYMIYFYQNLRNSKKLVLLFVAIFLISYTLDIIYSAQIKWIPITPFEVGGIILITCSVLSFIEISNIKYTHSLMENPLFWVSCAILSYYLPTIILLAPYSYFFSITPEVYGKAFLNSQLILNMIHYTLLSIAFICQIKIKNIK